MPELTNRDKITIFLSLLGPEVAARVLKYLPDELARLAAAGIERLPLPSPDAVQTVLEEFNRFYLTAGSEVKVLSGEVKPEAVADPFDGAIRKLGLSGFWKVLAGEDLTTVAFILSFISNSLRQGLLGVLDAGQRQTIENLSAKIRRSPLASQITMAFKDHLLKKMAAA